MAEQVTSWLAKAVVEHDRINGSNLKIEKNNIKRLVQINTFYTYRNPTNPKAQISGQISDKTHVVDVEFDVDATNEFEIEDTDLKPERLTANVRAILMIKAYRWKVEKCPGRRTKQGLEMPKLKMEILKFDIRHGGDLPTYFEDTEEVGMGRDDGEAQKVLRKWFFGESYSDLSEVEKSFEQSQPEAGPSRLLQSSPAKAASQRDTTLPENVISLSDFLEPYLSNNGSKRGKPIPDWIFEITEADEVALEKVGVFGLDLGFPDELGNQVSQPAQAPAPSSSFDLRPVVDHYSQMPKGKGKERAHFPTSSPPITSSKASANTTIFQAQTPPFTLAQRVKSTQTATQPNPNTQSPLADNEESESDGELPVITLRQAVKRPTKAIFDPLAFSQSSGESASATQYLVKGKGRAVEADGIKDQSGMLSDSQTGSEGLSDYEREARRQLKRKRATSTGKDQSKRKTTSPSKEARRQPEIVEDESIPASESYESYSLTKQYPPSSKESTQQILEPPSETRRTSTKAVDHSVQPSSLDKNVESLESDPTKSNESSLPTPPPSDHGRKARAPDTSPRAETSTEPCSIPKAELVTPSISSERKATRTEVDVGSRNEAEVSRSVKPARVGSSSKRVSIGGASRGSESRERKEPVVAGPSRATDTSTRRAQPGPSSSSTTKHRSQGRAEMKYTLDLTIDGLTADQVQDYIDKVRIAREKLGST